MVASKNTCRSVAVALSLVLAGCATTPPPPVVELVEIHIECSAPLPDWVFEEFEIPGMDRVRLMGGTNGAMLTVFGLQTFMLESANMRLGKIQEIQVQNRDPRCKE